MPVQDAVRSRLRDPWFLLALLQCALFPVAWLVASLAGSSRMAGDPHDTLIAVAGPAAGLLPLLVFFLVASAPEVRTRAEAMDAFWGDVAMVGAAFALGWGVPGLVLGVLQGGGAFLLVTGLLVLATAMLLFAAWRALAGACDAPGLDTGRLLRRLFVLWLVLSVFLPSLLQFAIRNPMEPSTLGVVLRVLTPEGAYQLLVQATFPESVAGGFYPGRESYGAWYSPATFGLALVAWAAVPLALLRRKYPEAPPAAPPEETIA